MVDAEDAAATTPTRMTRYAAARVAALAAARPLRLRAQEGLAELRDGAREGLRRRGGMPPSGRAAGSSPTALLERLPLAARRGGGAAPRRARCARTSSSACSPTGGCATLFARALDASATSSRSTPPTSSSCWRTRPRPTPSSGRLVAGAKRLAARGAARALRGGLHGGARDARHAAAATPTCSSTCVGYLKRRLDAASAPSSRALIDDYRLGLVPLVVPLTLMQHHVRRLDVAYLSGQVYSLATPEGADAPQPRLILPAPGCSRLLASGRALAEARSPEPEALCCVTLYT